jgi:outer membrane protein TolC
MRWKKWVGGLALLAGGVVGCKQEVFMTLPDRQETKALALGLVENNPRVVDNPLTALVPAPATTSNPDRPPRYISLAEAISIALEQGSVGNTNIFIGSSAPTVQAANPFFEQLGSFIGGRFNGSGDAVRVLRLDPAIAGAAVDSALSKFDAVWSNSATWTTTDQPIATSLQTFQAGNQVNTIMTQDATVRTALIKPLSTGGVAGITFRTDYTYTNLPSRVNPAYRPNLQFAFEQPLLQGFGTEINELRPNHPGSILNPGTFNTQPTAEGILLTRLRYDQERADFERLIHFMLLNTELAYWNLYAAYWELYAQESGLRIAFEAWRVVNAKYQAGGVDLATFSQARGQYELFRSQRLSALNNVLELERQFRGLLNLPVEDGTRLVPADSPTLAPYVPDWTSALQEALTLQPALVLAREEVKAAEMNVILARNNVLPDVRLTATWDVNAVGSRLDGSDGPNAFRNLASDRFHNWTIGVQGNIPIGYRDAHAKIRVAKLQLARSLEVVRDQELKVQRAMGAVYRFLDTDYEQIRINRAQREANQQQLRILAEQVRNGKRVYDVTYLQAQRDYVTALAAEYDSIRNYNQSLIGWEYIKGTIMQHDNVVISEGPLPCAVQERAVEHQRQRTAALLVRERARPVELVPLHPDGDKGVLPVIPPDAAPSLPALMQGTPPLPPEMPLDRPLPAPAPLKLDPAKPADLPKPGKPPEPKGGPGKELPPVGLDAAKPKPDAKAPKPADAKAGTGVELPPIGSVGTTERRPAVDWSLAEQPVTPIPPPKVGERGRGEGATAPKKPTDFGTMRPSDAKPPQTLTPGAPTPVEAPKLLDLPRPAAAPGAPTPVGAQKLPEAPATLSAPSPPPTPSDLPPLPASPVPAAPGK